MEENRKRGGVKVSKREGEKESWRRGVEEEGTPRRGEEEEGRPRRG